MQETKANSTIPVKNADGSESTLIPSRIRNMKPTAHPFKKYADTPCKQVFFAKSRKGDEKEKQH